MLVVVMNKVTINLAIEVREIIIFHSKATKLTNPFLAVVVDKV